MRAQGGGGVGGYMDVGDGLAGAISGDVVRGEDDAVMFYSADAGPFAARPAAAAVPRDEADAAAAVRFAAEHGIPVTARGGGTGLAGGAVGAGIVLDMRLLDSAEFDAGRPDSSGIASVTAEAGTPKGRIDGLLAAHGSFLGPNPSVGPYCTAGGMVATNASGSRSLKYGSVIDNLLGVRIIDGLGRIADLPADGALSERMLSASAPAGGAPAGGGFPRVAKNSCGYRIDAFRSAADSHKVVAGSEGTLGVIVSARLRAARLPEGRRLYAVACRSPADAAADCASMRSAAPSAIEYIDRHAASWMGGVVPGDAACVLLAEFDEPAEPGPRERRLLSSLRGAVAASTCDGAEMLRWWRMRDAALSRTLGSARPDSGPPRPPAHIVEDAAVPPGRVGDLLALISALEEKFGLRAIVYGHIGSGNLHVRLAGGDGDDYDAGASIAAGLRDGGARMRRIAEWYFERVVALGGTVTGEHGDGLARTWFVGRQYGGATLGRFAALKALMDPRGILNPGKVLPRQGPCK